MDRQNFIKELTKNGFTNVGVEEDMLCIYLENYAVEGKEKELMKQMQEISKLMQEKDYKKSYIIKNPQRKNIKISD